MNDKIPVDLRTVNIAETAANQAKLTGLAKIIPKGVIERLAGVHFDKTGSNRVGGVALTTTTVEALPSEPETTTIFPETPPITETMPATTVPETTTQKSAPPSTTLPPNF